MPWSWWSYCFKNNCLRLREMTNLKSEIIINIELGCTYKRMWNYEIPKTLLTTQSHCPQTTSLARSLSSDLPPAFVSHIMRKRSLYLKSGIELTIQIQLSHTPCYTKSRGHALLDAHSILCKLPDRLGWFQNPLPCVPVIMKLRPHR